MFKTPKTAVSLLNYGVDETPPCLKLRKLALDSMKG